MARKAEVKTVPKIVLNKVFLFKLKSKYNFAIKISQLVILVLIIFYYKI